MARIDINPRKSRKLLWIGIVASFFLILTSSILIIIHFITNEKVAFTTKQNPIIYEGKIYKKDQAFIQNEEVYLPFTFIKEKIDKEILYDKDTNSVIVTTNDQVIQFPNENLQYFINEEPFSLQVPALVSKDGILYVAAKPIFSIYPFKMDYNTETGVVVLKKQGDVILPGTVITNKSLLKLREKPTVFSGYVAEVSNNEKVTIEKGEKNYYYIRKNNGIAGYIKKESIILDQPIVVQVNPFPNKKRNDVPKIKWPINLTWEAVYKNNPDTAQISAMPGLNVISPTWFSLKNGEGDINSLASIDYVKWAKSKKYNVWALFSNNSDPKVTHTAIKDFKTRQKIIRQILQYVTMYQLDGINIDFENVNLADRDLITEFVKELTAYLHQEGIVVSMDITFISSSENWSMFYDRKRLSEIVDYLMVMAYDEHWATSPVAGSVASLPWVEHNLVELLKIIPNERLILGVPTYTRIWKEQKTPGGNIEVSSKAYSIDAVKQWIIQHGLPVTYDNKTGQDYAEYVDNKENVVYKVWLENDKSLYKRGQLVHKYHLAGIASWNRNFANHMAWTKIDDSLRQIKPIEN